MTTFFMRRWAYRRKVSITTSDDVVDQPCKITWDFTDLLRNTLGRPMETFDYVSSISHGIRVTDGIGQRLEFKTEKAIDFDALLKAEVTVYFWIRQPKDVSRDYYIFFDVLEGSEKDTTPTESTEDIVGALEPGPDFIEGATEIGETVLRMANQLNDIIETLDFSEIVLGESRTQKLEVRNIGTEALNDVLVLTTNSGGDVVVEHWVKYSPDNGATWPYDPTEENQFTIPGINLETLLTTVSFSGSAPWHTPLTDPTYPGQLEIAPSGSAPEEVTFAVSGSDKDDAVLVEELLMTSGSDSTQKMYKFFKTIDDVDVTGSSVASDKFEYLLRSRDELSLDVNVEVPEDASIGDRTFKIKVTY